jgi:NAD+-dependent protein deacetylase sirtuin 4
MPTDADTSAHIDVTALAELLRDRRAVVLAGAGCSTESGIPDYRGPEGRMHERMPVQYGDFVRSEPVRRRYWARSTMGWGRMSGAEPNPAHVGLARLEAAGLVAGVITQNVDGLHHAGGSRRVVELHGSLASVGCLACGARTEREALQARMLEANAAWVERVRHAPDDSRPTPAPDGDAELPDDVYGSFVAPTCASCGGMLKPDVVFFGENVPKARVDEAWRLLDEGDVLLVAGSSLTVYSGRRFIYRAVERPMPIGVVNLGPTRADDVATVKVEGRLGEVVPKLVEALGAA